jgi:hypothetical protein
VVLGDELHRYPPGLGEQHGGGQAGTGHGSAGNAADHDSEFADARQGVQCEQGVHGPVEACAIHEGEGADAGRVGQSQAQRDGAAGGMADHVKGRLDAEGVKECRDERSEAVSGGVVADRRVALAGAGQAPR